jgi:hypothetical protein
MVAEEAEVVAVKEKRLRLATRKKIEETDLLSTLDLNFFHFRA